MLNWLISNWIKGKIKDYTKYKARIKGIRVVPVNENYTTRVCSKCGALGKTYKNSYLKEEDKGGGHFHCSKCGYSANRDYNASLNIGRLCLSGQRDIRKLSKVVTYTATTSLGNRSLRAYSEFEKALKHIRDKSWVVSVSPVRYVCKCTNLSLKNERNAELIRNLQSAIRNRMTASLQKKEVVKMSFLVLNNLGVSLGDFNLENINLDLDKGEFFVVLGPTGSGKTILLESIAGFHSIKGKIFIDGREVTNHPPEKRNIGFMFQDYALFPHLKVYQNVKFGLKYKKIANADKKVMELLDLVGVSALKNRKIETLSGGEQQRVALARALVVEPQILLLDEPLSALDVHTKESLRNEMKNIIESLKITTIYVTHDQSEAELLANRIGLMMNGKIVQVDHPIKFFNSPKNKEVAEFIGMENILHGTVVFSEKDYAIIKVADTKIEAITSYGVGEKVQVCIRPENIFLHNQKYTTSARNQFIGEIVDLISLGPIVKVILDCGFKLSVIVTKRSVEDLDLRIGKKVYASFKATAIHVI